MAIDTAAAVPTVIEQCSDGSSESSEFDDTSKCPSGLEHGPQLPERDGSDGAKCPSSPRTPKTSNYGSQSYWDARYADETKPGTESPSSMEWYLSPHEFALHWILKRHIPLSSRFLQVGVGTSELQVALVQDAGYQHVVSIDYAAVAIEHLQKLHADVPQLTYLTADCRYMPDFADESFDAVLDKGTLDAMLCSETAEADTASMLQECFRVLAPGGTFVEISFGPPERRVSYLESLQWQIIVYAVRSQTAEGAQKANANGPGLRGPVSTDEAHSLNGLESLMDEAWYFVYLCTKQE